MKKICLILVALTLAAVCHAKTYDLHYNLKPGKTYSNHAKAEMRMTISDSIAVGLDMIAEMALEVKAKRDTLYDMEVTFKRIRIATQGGPHKIVIDSDDKENVSYESVSARTMIGKPFTWVMSDRGQVVEFGDLDKLFDPEGMDFTGVPEETVQKVSKEMEKSKTDNASTMKQVKEMTSGMATFPSHPVAIGEEWETSFIMKEVLGIAANARYKLADVTPDHFVVDMTTDMSVDKPGNETKSTFGVVASMEGTMLLDRNTCLLESMTIDMVLKPTSKNPKADIKTTARIIVTDGRER